MKRAVQKLSNPKPIVEVAIVGMCLPLLFCMLNGVAQGAAFSIRPQGSVKVCAGHPGGVAIYAGASFEGFKVFAACLQIVASIGPLLCFMPAWYSGEPTYAALWFANPTNTSKKDTVPVDFTAPRSTLE